MTLKKVHLSAAEIVEYFYNSPIKNRRTIKNLAELKPEWIDSLDMRKLLSDCEKLSADGILMELSSGNNVLERCYYAPSFDKDNAVYGKYDYITGGFEKIIENLAPSVFPVVVEKKDGSCDLGTGFVVGNENTFFTARHVVENMKSIKILGSNGNAFPIFGIYVSNNENIDIAVIHTHISDCGNIRPFKISAKISVLSEILSIGYPPIPGFNSLKICDISHVNSYVRLAKGRIVGSGCSYLDSQDFLLFNARVKGGNSGGPIINNRGVVVGMLVQIPIDTEDSSKLDNLGYGIAVTGQNLLDALQFIQSGRKLKLTDLGEYEYSTL